MGASGGSDTHKFVAGIHLGYEHNYVLPSGWTFYWQVKNDVIIKGADLFRTGIALGKMCIRDRNCSKKKRANATMTRMNTRFERTEKASRCV